MIKIENKDIPKEIFNMINEDYKLSNLSKKEFDNILNSFLWETYIGNSYEGNTSQGLDFDFLDKNYINNDLQNELIGLYQQLTIKLENKDTSDIKINDSIIIKNNEFEAIKRKVGNILVANNINYLKHILATDVILRQENFGDGISYGMEELIKGFLKFDLDKGDSFMGYIKKFLIGSVRKTKQDKLIKIPLKVRKINSVLKKIYDNEKYVNLSTSDLLNKLVFQIEKIDKEIVKEIGSLYFYILSIGEVNLENFCKTYGIKENTELNTFFDNPDNVKIFIKELGNYLKKSNSIESKEKQIKLLSYGLDNIKEGQEVISLDKETGEDSTIMDFIFNDETYGGVEMRAYRKQNLEIFNKEIRHLKRVGDKVERVEPNADFTLLERIIAGTCINEYFTFKEFRDLLIEYGEEKGVGNKYAENFHLYLSLFNFKDKSNWYQYDNEVLDALNYQQMGDILGFSRTYAIKVYNKLKKKFDDFYGPYLTFVRYDTSYHGKSKSFKDLKNAGNKEKTNK